MKDFKYYLLLLIKNLVILALTALLYALFLFFIQVITFTFNIDIVYFFKNFPYIAIILILLPIPFLWAYANIMALFFFRK